VRLTIEVIAKDGPSVTARVMLLNDSFEPVTFDRTLLVGPNLQFKGAGMIPVSTESRAGKGETSKVTLNPWCFYGRDRTFEAAGTAPEATFHAYLLSEPGPMLPKGPGGDAEASILAEPVRV
jgi:hypothetical protein